MPNSVYLSFITYSDEFYHKLLKLGHKLQNNCIQKLTQICCFFVTKFNILVTKFNNNFQACKFESISQVSLQVHINKYHQHEHADYQNGTLIVPDQQLSDSFESEQSSPEHSIGFLNDHHQQSSKTNDYKQPSPNPVLEQHPTFIDPESLYPYKSQMPPIEQHQILVDWNENHETLNYSEEKKTNANEIQQPLLEYGTQQNQTLFYSDEQSTKSKRSQQPSVDNSIKQNQMSINIYKQKEDYLTLENDTLKFENSSKLFNTSQHRKRSHASISDGDDDSEIGHFTRMSDIKRGNNSQKHSLNVSKSAEEMRAHMINELHSLEKYTCHFCHKEFQNKDRLINHLSEAHDMQENYMTKKPTQSFKCQECNFKTSVKSNLEIHFKSVHKNITKQKSIRKMFVDQVSPKNEVCDTSSETTDNNEKETTYYSEEKASTTHPFKMHSKKGSTISDSSVSKSKMFECEICKYKSTNFQNLKHHAKSVHLKQKDFACSNCFKTFLEERGLLKHEIVHTDHSGSFDCLRYSSKPWDVSVAFVMSEDSNILNCIVCSFTTLSMNAATSHAKLLHPDQRSYKCNKCHVELFNYVTLSDHLKNCFGQQIQEREHKTQMEVTTGGKRKQIPSGIGLKCNGCSKTFPVEESFKKHIESKFDCAGVLKLSKFRNNSISQGLEQLICSKCSHKSTTMNNFLRHEKECSRRKRVFSDEKSFLKEALQSRCQIRPSLTESCKVVQVKEEEDELSLFGFEADILSQHFESIFKEDDSFDSFKETSSYTCQACSSNFKSQIEYQIHSQVCSSLLQDSKDDNNFSGIVKPFQCNQCTYQSNHSANLRRHIKTIHLNERNFSCNGCTKSFIEKRSLTTHIERNCTGKNTSNKVVAIKTSEQEKQTTQEAEHMFSCTLCSHVTSSVESMNTHVKRMHDIKTENKFVIESENPITPKAKLLCDQCPYQTSAKPNLELHIKNVHLKLWEYKCEGCSRHFSEKKYFQKHKNFNQTTVYLKCSNYTKITPIPADMIFYNEETKSIFCISCNHFSTSMAEIEQHVKKHHANLRTFTCNKCHSEFRKKIKLFRHLKKCYEPKDGNSMKKEIITDIFRCELCKYQCSVISKMCLHNRVVHYTSLLNYPDCFHSRCGKAKLKDLSLAHFKPIPNYKRTVFNCENEKCDYQSPSRALWQKHVKSKHAKSQVCDSCFASFENEAQLAKHLASNSDSTSSLACSKFSTQTADCKGQITHSEETNLYKCKICNYISEALDQANSHFLKNHSISTRYYCNGCILELTNLKDLYLHLLDCQTTDLSSEEKLNLQDIIKKISPELDKSITPKETERPDIKCNECNYKTKVPQNLVRHNKTIHLNVRDIICESCLSAYTHKDTMIKHKRSNSDLRGELQCHAFTAKSFEISELMTLNEVDVEFCCLLCNHSEQSEDSLKHHIVTDHPSNLKFICNRCKVYCPDKAALVSHIKTSHLTKLFPKIKFCQDISDMSIKNVDTRELICMSCDFVSAHPPDARAHIFDNHITLAQYTCDKCKHDFASNRISFLRHLRMCYANDPKAEFVACHVCPYATKESFNLLAHFKRRHRIPIE